MATSQFSAIDHLAFLREFVGPPRKRYEWMGSRHFDPRCTTGESSLCIGFDLKSDFCWPIDDVHPLDAPQSIAAGGMHGHVFEDDPEYNIFPMTVWRG